MPSAAAKMLLIAATLVGSSLAITNKGASSNSTSGCKADEFQCLDMICIPRSKLCDGHKDCYLHEDESNCEGLCEEGFFHCDDGHCISNQWVCDGQNDCMDWTDEKNCPQEKFGQDYCQSDQFACKGLCILPEWLCDGTDDCIDGEDEAPEVCSPENRTIKPCAENEFECSPGDCIPHRWVCDDSADCANGADEGEHCGEHREDCTIEKGYFKCGNTTRCLESKYVCDGVPQCKDAEDEGKFCEKKACKSKVCSHHCIEGPAGATCYCDDGMKLNEATGKDCEDVDECQEYGKCSQVCTNNYGNYSCSCYPDYRLINGSCYVDGADVILYFSTENSIRSLNVRTNVYDLVVDGLKHVVGVAYDGVDDRVYWTDVRKNTEQVESIDVRGRDRRVLLTNGLDIPEDIVVDSASRNFYFSDSHKGHIVVCSLDGSVCTVLDDKNGNPRGMAIHYKQRLLFFADWGDKPAVVRIGLDGSERKEIATENLKWPNGVAVDQLMDRVYWSDAKLNFLESAKLDGSDRRTVLQDITTFHPFSLAIFEDTLYWSDWSRSQLASCNKFTGKQQKVLMKEAGIKVMGITLYHPSLQDGVTNPCRGHQCSHLCLPKPKNSSQLDAYTCACPEHMKLNSDGHACKLKHGNSLVIAVNGNLFSLDPHNVGRNELEPVTTIREEIRYMAADNLNGGLLVTNNDNAIYRVDVHEKIKKLVSIEPFLSHVVYDPIDENLFWIDTHRKSILVQSIKTQATKVIVKNLANPKALAFCIEDRRIIFLDEHKIVTATPQGTQIALRSHNVPSTVRHIHYVEANHTLLLGDSTAGTVHQLDLHTGQLTMFLAGMQSITSMTVFDGHFYWTQHTGNELFWVKFQKDISMSDIAWMSLSSVSESPLDLVLLSSSSNMTMVYKDIPRPCLEAGCEQFCFSHSGEAKCSCETGHNVLDDGKSCKEGCPEHMVACQDEKNRCIQHSWVCDGHADCLNGMDEKNCTVAEICDPKTSFKCKNGECLKDLGFKCDGDKDCGDGSDEDDCPPIVCEENKYMCANKAKCIFNMWKCDKIPDCPDGDDELNCPPEECKEGTWRCKDGGCIPERWVCDENPDCEDGSDEEQCKPKEESCSERSMFSCANGLCVDLDLVCDRENDCGDGSDEREGFCHKPESRTVICPEGFICDDKCLPEHARCNGVAECTDESDEANCSITCDYEGAWMCRDGKRCINFEWVCDGSKDCADGSDEEDNCPAKNVNTCSEDQYHCNTGECIDLKKACDGYSDCEDGSDESEAECKVCDQSNGGCLHVCHSTPKGRVCGCRDGYISSKVNGVVHCMDRNECQEDKCPQDCQNTKGSYKCTCTNGFISEHSGHYCRAKGENMKILFVTGGHIKGVDPATNGHYLYANYSEHIRAFAVNQQTGEIFTTLPSKEVIARTTLRDHSILSNSPARESNKIWKSDIERIDMIAVDWITGNIYFSQMLSPEITVCNKNKDCTTLIKAKHPIITGIALDPTTGRMFVASFKSGFLSSATGGINSCGMDGDIKEEYELTDGKLVLTGGLSVDVHKKRVYWVDKNRGQLFSNNYYGTNLRMMVEMSSPPNYLTNFENKIFWLEPQNNQIALYDPMSSTILDYSQHPVNSNTDGLTHSILVMQEQQQPVVGNPCSDAGCSHICLLGIGMYKSAPPTYRCACPTGYLPSKLNGKQCVPVPSDLDSKEKTPELGKDRNAEHDELVEGDIKKEPVEASNTSSIIGAVVAVVLLLLLIIGIVVFVYYKKKGDKGQDMMFSNLGYSKANDSNHDQPVVERGTIVSCDNPMFVDSHTSTPPRSGLRSRLDMFRFRSGQPKMATMSIGNSPNMDFSSILSVAKGASTPNQPRKEMREGDSAFIEEAASIDYEDFSDQHLSVMFHKDKQRLLSDDSV